MMKIAVLLFVVVLSLYVTVEATKPNIILILTDDQDVYMGSSERDIIPSVYEHIADKGVKGTNFFATTPVCCPSRSSLVTGRYIHNVGVTNNSIAGNCAGIPWQQGPEKENIGVYMQKAGYQTFYSGKYLNNYGFTAVGGVEYVPPGWTDWQTLVGNSRYYDFSLSNNGVEEKHGNDYASDYLPDLVANKTLAFLDKQTADSPFFAIMAPPSCHDNTTPAPQYAGKFAGRKAPRTPNYGKYSEDKAPFVKQFGALGMPEDRQAVTDWQYRRRLETLQSVDDMVDRVVSKLDAMGVLDNSYIFYTADNGYHFGQFGLLKDKRFEFEFDVRLPFFGKGPGIPVNVTSPAVMTMVDLFATFVSIAGLDVPSNIDGIDQMPALQNPPSEAGRSFLVEYNGEKDGTTKGVCATLCTKYDACYIEGPEMSTPPVFTGTTVCSPQDSPANTYRCTRTMNSTDNTLFCKFVGGFEEFYSLTDDYWQRQNNVSLLSPGTKSALESQLADFASCAGSTCHKLYN